MEVADVGRVDQLLAELRKTLELTLERGRMGPVPAEGLRAALQTVDVLAEKLAKLQTMVVLEELSPDDDSMSRAHAQWLMVDTDRPTTAHAALISASPTLSTLRKVAVDIVSMYRYSKERVELASQIGEWCGAFPQYVGMLADDRRTEFSISHDALDGVDRLLRALARADAIEGFHLQGRIEPKGKPGYWRNRDASLRDSSITKWRVRRGKVHGDYGAFLRGHWLTAYAYGIALDQFGRAGAPFEIYSNVQYTLPRDLGGGKSDIDVLVRTADVLLCVECKAGRVLTSYRPDQPSAAAKALIAAERMDKLLDTMGVSLHRHYQLLYLPGHGQQRRDVMAATSGGRVPLLVTTPADVRVLIQTVALRQPLASSDPVVSEDAS